MSWKLKKSQVVFDKYMRIEERIYEMPDGDLKDFYIKVAKPAVCVLAITEHNKVIIVEQFRPGPNKVLNELPGGLMEDGETPEQAMARELREETGFEGDLKLVTYCLDDAYSTMKRACFVATNCHRVAEQQLDKSEFIRVKLIELNDFLKIVRSGEMTDVEVALLGLDSLKLL